MYLYEVKEKGQYFELDRLDTLSNGTYFPLAAFKLNISGTGALSDNMNLLTPLCLLTSGNSRKSKEHRLSSLQEKGS